MEKPFFHKVFFAQSFQNFLSAIVFSVGWLQLLSKGVLMKTFVLATLSSFCLFAQDMVITVWCTNGVGVPGLPVKVIDANRNILFEGATNRSGGFTMSQHIAPIYMIFSAANGSTCGPYNVQLDDPNAPTEGTITLQYYPTNVPCSCAPYTR